ncbi:MAG: pirin family protein [Melioribacteraceae bacterium]|nr:pirin family protein [Melioribacteraceae bacterium]
MNKTNEDNNRLLLRRSDERGYEDFGWADNWMTFSFANYHNPEWNNFGPLRVMVENHIQPHSGFPSHPHKDVEIVTYVSSGILTHGDNFGHKADVKAYEMQLISAGSKGMIHSEENLQNTVEHNYQMWLIPDRSDTSFSYGQKGFSKDELKGNLRLYISPDGRDGSMKINTDAYIYAGLFSAGDKYTYRLSAGRGVWLQVVKGILNIADQSLESGDGIGIRTEDEYIIEFNDDTEILLFDVSLTVPLIWK